jgi:hypothetical protein
VGWAFTTRRSIRHCWPTSAAGWPVPPAPTAIFEAVREVVKATGVLKGKHRRALDSTVLDDAVAIFETVTTTPALQAA